MFCSVGHYMLFDLIWFVIIFLHIIGWRLSVSINDMLYVLVKLSVLAKWLAIERPLWWYLHEVRRLPPQSPGGRACLCVFFFRLVCLCCYVFSPGPTQYIFHTPMARYSLFVLKVPLNTKQNGGENWNFQEMCSQMTTTGLLTQIFFRPDAKALKDARNPCCVLMCLLSWCHSVLPTLDVRY